MAVYQTGRYRSLAVLGSSYRICDNPVATHKSPVGAAEGCEGGLSGKPLPINQPLGHVDIPQNAGVIDVD